MTNPLWLFFFLKQFREDPGSRPPIEYVEGGNLTHRLSGTPQPARQAAEFVETLSRAMHAAHKAGIIHRDLKPANVLLTVDGIPKITDFGLAKRLDAETQHTQSGAVMGTPSYMAPEQASGRIKEISPAADVYALGAILYEMLVGRPPFKGESLWETVQQVISEDPVPPRQLQPKLPRDLETICLKCSQKDPRKRYATALELAEDLQRYAHREPIRARPVTVCERSVKWARRRPAMAALLGVSMVSALSLFIGTILYNSHLQAAKKVAEGQRTEAVGNLYHSLIREARALRLARRDGFRRQAWDRLRKALALDTHEKNLEQLRQEAVACMGDYVGLEPTLWDQFSAEVSVIALHPQAPQLAIGLYDGTVLIRDFTTGGEVARLQAHGSRIHALVFGPSGRRLFSADERGTIKAWEPDATGAWTAVRTFTTNPPGLVWRTFLRHVSLAVSPDGNRLAVCSEGTSKISLWSLSDGARAGDLDGGEVDLHYVAWSGDGKLVVAGYGDHDTNGMLVWDAAARTIRQRLSPDLGRVFAVASSADGKFVACGCNYGMAVYDTAQFQLQSFERGDLLASIAFNPAGPFLAVPCWLRGQVRLWEFSANRDVALLAHPGTLHSVVFSGDGRVLISADERAVRIWRLYTDEKLDLPENGGKVRAGVFSPDGHIVGLQEGKAIVWDPATGQVIRDFGIGGPKTKAWILSADGRTLATVDQKGTIRIFDMPSGKELSGAVYGGDVFNMAFSPDGKYFAAGGDNGLKIGRVLDEGTPGNKKLQLDPGPPGTNGFTPCFSSTGKLLAWVKRGTAARGSHTVHLWDLEHSRERACRIPRLAYHISSLALFPDGERLVFVNEDEEIEVWNVASDQKVCSFGRGELQPAAGRIVALSGDGSWLAVAGGRVITVWNTETQKLLLALPQGVRTVSGLAWSPDKSILATRYYGGGDALWYIPRVRTQLAELGLDW